MSGSNQQFYEIFWLVKNKNLHLYKPFACILILIRYLGGDVTKAAKKDMVRFNAALAKTVSMGNEKIKVKNVENLV